MSELRPCPECHRHIRIEESACPFCEAATAPAEPRKLRVGGLTRAAVFASALAGAAACGPSQSTATKGDQTQPNGTGDQTPPPPPEFADAGAPAAAPADAATPPNDVKPPPDHNVPMPYGAPPSRGRLV